MRGVSGGVPGRRRAWCVAGRRGQRNQMKPFVAVIEAGVGAMLGSSRAGCACGGECELRGGGRGCGCDGLGRRRARYVGRGGSDSSSRRSQRWTRDARWQWPIGSPMHRTRRRSRGRGGGRRPGECPWPRSGEEGEYRIWGRGAVDVGVGHIMAEDEIECAIDLD